LLISCSRKTIKIPSQGRQNRQAAENRWQNAETVCRGRNMVKTR